MSREAHVPFYEGLGVQFPRPTHRYCLSFRDVEDLLAERGIIVSYETVRQWCGKCGPDYARQLKRRQGRLGDTWFLDEVFETINAGLHVIRPRAAFLARSRRHAESVSSGSAPAEIGSSSNVAGTSVHSVDRGNSSLISAQLALVWPGLVSLTVPTQGLSTADAVIPARAIGEEATG